MQLRNSNMSFYLEVLVREQITYEKLSLSLYFLRFFSYLSYLIIRRSHRSCFFKKDVLKNVVKLTGKHLFQGFFLIKLLALGHPCNCFGIIFFFSSFTIMLMFSRLQMFFKISVLINFIHFTGKHQCWSPFLL